VGGGNNLVTNGDFENGITGWSVWGGILQTTAGYQGMSALHTARTADWQGPVYSLLSKVVAGEDYSISAWAKVVGSSSEPMNITVKTVCDSGAEAYNWGGGATVNDSGWTQVSGSVTLPNCVLTDVVLYFSGPAVGVDILLDNVQVEGAVPVVSSNLVTNGDFESGVGGWVAWVGSLGVSTDAHSGSQSAVLTGRTDTWQGPVYNLLSAVTPGATYNFNAWGKVAGSASEPMSITVKTTCDDGSEAYNYVGGATVTDTSWTELNGSLTMPSCVLTEVSMYFDGPAAGVDSLLDDVSVELAE
jgi:hypothetical protein